MALLKSVLQLLFLGVLISPAYLQEHPCMIASKTVRLGSYNLNVAPPFYRPGAIYTVAISGIDNSTSLVLQAVPSGSSSAGLWEGESQISCQNNEDIVQKNISGSSARTRWTSPSNANVQSAEIRAFVSFANGTTLLQTRTLERASMASSVTPAPSTVSQPATGPHRSTVLDNSTNTHAILNSTHHHVLVSSHQGTKGSGSMAQASSFILAVTQVLSVFLGFKLLS